MPLAFKIQIQPVSQGATVSEGSPVAPSIRIPDGLKQFILRANEAQIIGLQNYCNVINAGIVTTTVEDAITAILP